MKESRIEFVYRITGVLCHSVPPKVFDDVKTALIMHGVNHMSKCDNELFIILRNRKMDLLRKYKRDKVYSASVEFDEEYVKNDVEEVQDLSKMCDTIYATYGQLTKRNQTFVRHLIKLALHGHRVNFTVLGYSMNISRQRVKHHYVKFLQTMKQIDKEDRYDLPNVQTARKLHDLIRGV